MRLGFMGTPEFSVHTLQAIIDAGHDVAVVYTQPPRPKGRGKKITPCPVHAYAISQGIEVLNPISFKDNNEIETLKSYNLDALVVVAYGIILPQAVLDVPKLGCFNGHASILPRWRGAAPIQRAIEAGDSDTGVCIMKMDAGLDTGDVLSENIVDIPPKMTAGQLHDVLADLTGVAIVPVLQSVENGTAICTPQAKDGVCYANKLLKSESVIDWSDSAVNISNRVRAFNPFPSSSTVFGDMVVKILEVVVSDINVRGGHGQVLNLSPLVVSCGSGAVEIVLLQKAGKKPVLAKEFLNGYALNIGDTLGK